jgi:hypothetical protein
LRRLGDHGELHAERAQYGAHGFITRMGAAAESLVKALAAEAGRLVVERIKQLLALRSTSKK